MLFYDLMILLSQNSLFRGPAIFYQDVSSSLKSPSFKDNELVVLCSDTLGYPWVRFYSFIYTIYKSSQTLCWYLKAWPPHTRYVVMVSFLLVTNDACAVHIKKTYPKWCYSQQNNAHKYGMNSLCATKSNPSFLPNFHFCVFLTRQLFMSSLLITRELLLFKS